MEGDKYNALHERLRSLAATMGEFASATESAAKVAHESRDLALFFGHTFKSDPSGPGPVPVRPAPVPAPASRSATAAAAGARATAARSGKKT